MNAVIVDTLARLIHISKDKGHCRPRDFRLFVVSLARQIEDFQTGSSVSLQGVIHSGNFRADKWAYTLPASARNTERSDSPFRYV